MGLTILGIVLTAVGLFGLISLWPSVTVTPLPPTDPKQPFSVPFKITNSGYLPIKRLQIVCYAHSVKVGGVTITDSMSSNRNWNTDYLGRGESLTIITNFVHSHILPAEADIAIVVDYRPIGVPFATLRTICRFMGHFGESWQWLQQASRPIRDKISTRISYWAQQQKNDRP